MSAEKKIQMIRARDSTWRNPLVRMQVDRVSDSYVWVDGKQISRVVEGTRVFHDFESAKSWLLSELSDQIAQLAMKIEKLKQRRISVRSIVENDIPDENDRY